MVEPYHPAWLYFDEHEVIYQSIIPVVKLPDV
jgi:hypothetical protein